ncbi:hypothetical protein F900_02096 [Acinetobacter modestus]|uniref:Methyltransferase small domain-containing protein n=1 Tax=Acinetobacter modestus TaxID=1776740 RepID=N9NEJ9_9GAMM|nr:hypothetical protein [Acinetobacter modestus]ENX00425.1 hypothetical protein F900_02096 [Acinetobacter modestus]
MNIQLTNEITYADLWERDSNTYEFSGLYEKLANVMPEGRTLEVGTGIGLGTIHISQKNEILSLDKNEYLVEKARKNLLNAGIKDTIHICNIFNLCANDIKIISNFKPKVITGWFIGSHSEDYDKYAGDIQFLKRPQHYRQRMEDIIISEIICVQTVDFIHFAVRGGIVDGYSEDEAKSVQAKFYNEYVFNKINFEVSKIDLFEWDDKNLNMQYVTNRSDTESKSYVFSIIAKRNK